MEGKEVLGRRGSSGGSVLLEVFNNMPYQSYNRSMPVQISPILAQSLQEINIPTRNMYLFIEYRKIVFSLGSCRVQMTICQIFSRQATTQLIRILSYDLIFLFQKVLKTQKCCNTKQMSRGNKPSVCRTFDKCSVGNSASI